MQTPEHETLVPGEIPPSGEIYQSPKGIEKGEGTKGAPASVHSNTNQTVQGATQTQTSDPTNNSQDDVIEVVIPDQPSKYANWKKNPSESSATWLAAFWDRVVKKAKLFGWHVLIKQNK